MDGESKNHSELKAGSFALSGKAFSLVRFFDAYQRNEPAEGGTLLTLSISSMESPPARE
jgi:hypothetical protein